MPMRTVLVVLLISTLVAGVILVRGRSLGPGAETGAMPPVRKGPPIGGFSESLFKFAATGKDDGAGQRTDWQEASATLTFSDPSAKPSGSWTCDVVVGMPLRTEKWGEIAPDYAAYAAATAATSAASAVMARKADGSTEDFCKQWRDEMQGALDSIQGLGAKVNGSRS
jgi:hypothetical protein